MGHLRLQQVSLAGLLCTGTPTCGLKFHTIKVLSSAPVASCRMLGLNAALVLQREGRKGARKE